MGVYLLATVHKMFACAEKKNTNMAWKTNFKVAEIHNIILLAPVDNDMTQRLLQFMV